MEMAIFIYQQQEPGVYVIIKMTHLPCLILIWLTLCLQVMAALTNVVFIAVDDLRPELGCY